MKNPFIVTLGVVCFLILIQNMAIATPIINGDFSSNYTGWTQYQDDSYYPNSTFFTIGGTTNHYAKVSIDLDLNGDGITDTDAYACDLYQTPDFSAPTGSKLTLSFDWLLDGDPTANSTSDNDIFNVYFDDGSGNTYDANGDYGYLLQTFSYGSTWNHFSTDISHYLNSSVPYNLTFELESSLADDGYGNYWVSYFCLDNVQITVTTPTNTVPEPCTIFLLSAGLLALSISYRFHIQRKYRGRD